MLLPIVLTLTYRRHSTDAECRSCGREAELIQYCVGPCWINHSNITAGGRTRNYPHRTLAEKDGYGVWKDEWHEMFSWPELVMGGWHWTSIWWLEYNYSCYLTRIIKRLTVASPETSGATATAQFSWKKGAILNCTTGIRWNLVFICNIAVVAWLTFAVESLWSSSLSCTRTGTSLGSGTGFWDSCNNNIEIPGQ